MYRNWKGAAALGLALLLGCMMPMSTMLAAEDDAGTGVCSDADAGMTGGDESTQEDENAAVEEDTSEGEDVSDVENGPEDENVPDGENTPEDEDVPDVENGPENENAADEEDTSEGEDVSDGENTPDNENVPDVENGPEDENVPDVENGPEDEDVSDVEDTPDFEEAGILTVPAAVPDAVPQEAEDSESTDAPEIVITRDGKESTCSLGGKITFEYIGNWGPQLEVTVSQGDQDMSVFWAKDKVADMEAEAKTEEQMSSLMWYKKEPSQTILLTQDGSYVIYVKMTAGEKNYYARSNGIVVDTKKPVIKGVEEGKTYPEGTVFQVEDANLDRVLVNEQPAVPEGGNYKVAANGTSCVIRAIDKAGNETACSITVLTEEKPETDHVISQSGVYALKAGEKYHLAQGQWKVDGDKSVYQGGNDFYVSADGNYSFAK